MDFETKITVSQHLFNIPLKDDKFNVNVKNNDIIDNLPQNSNKKIWNFFIHIQMDRNNFLLSL